MAATSLKVIDGMATANADRQKALDAALAQIDRAFGKGSAMKLGQREAMKVEAVSTGSLGLDIALGIGGLPKGRVVEIYGPESSGKTTLALHAIAEAQKNGGTAAFVDAEHALDPVYAKKLGVNIDELIVSQPDTGEQALEIADMLVRSGSVDIIIVDSTDPVGPAEGLFSKAFLPQRTTGFCSVILMYTASGHTRLTSTVSTRGKLLMAWCIAFMSA